VLAQDNVAQCWFATEGTAPFLINEPAAILSCLGNRPMAGDHRIDAAGKLHVPIQDRLAQLLVPALSAKTFKLVVRVENHRWMREAASWPAGIRMKAHDEEGLFSETQGKVRITWISTDTLVRSLPTPCILVCERLDAFP